MLDAINFTKTTGSVQSLKLLARSSNIECD